MTIYGIHFFLLIIAIATVSEFINAIFGGGHGTILTPFLLLLGFPPLSVVPSILLAETVGSILVSLAHHKIGNVNFAKNSSHLKTAIIFGIVSVLGILAAVLINFSLSQFYIKIYIGVLIIFIGILLLITMKKKFKYSLPKLVSLAIFASFNKGLSGAGYGPLITAGQILTGSKEKHAIGISSLSKGFTAAIASVAYFFFWKKINWILAPSLITGAIISVPFTAFMIKKMNDKFLRILVGVLAIVMGLLTLFQALSG